MSSDAEQKVYLGVDVGSVSTNFILFAPPATGAGGCGLEKNICVPKVPPLEVLRTGLRMMHAAGDWDILGVGTTGSGRELAGAVLGGRTWLKMRLPPTRWRLCSKTAGWQR